MLSALATMSEITVLFSNYIRIMWLSQELIAPAQMTIDDRVQSFNHN